MTTDDLERKIISVKKRGLNILVENELIRSARKEYYTELAEKKLKSISETFRKNVLFLGKVHGDYVTNHKIFEFMGIDMDMHVSRVLYENANVTSIRQALFVSEYYGVPVEVMLFQDIQANEETFKQLYPALFKQSRH